jgi:hypothetical protein
MHHPGHHMGMGHGHGHGGGGCGKCGAHRL